MGTLLQMIEYLVSCTKFSSPFFDKQLQHKVSLGLEIIRLHSNTQNKQTSIWPTIKWPKDYMLKLVCNFQNNDPIICNKTHTTCLIAKMSSKIVQNGLDLYFTWIFQRTLYCGIIQSTKFLYLLPL